MADTILETVQEAANNLVEKTTSEVDKSEEKKEEKKEEGPDPERVKSALQILDLLEDPEKSKTFVKALASQFEEKVQDLPKKDQKDAAKELLEELKNEIGEEHLDLLKPMLKVFNKLISERDDKILTNFKDLEVKIQRQQIERTYEDFMERNEVSQEEQDMMSKLAKEFPPSPDVTLNTYLTRIRKLAKSELGVVETSKSATKKADVLENNAKRDTFNKNSTGTKKEEPVIRNPKDAVLLAMQQLQEK